MFTFVMIDQDLLDLNGLAYVQMDRDQQQRISQPILRNRLRNISDELTTTTTLNSTSHSPLNTTLHDGINITSTTKPHLSQTTWNDALMFLGIFVTIIVVVLVVVTLVVVKLERNISSSASWGIYPIKRNAKKTFNEASTESSTGSITSPSPLLFAQEKLVHKTSSVQQSDKLKSVQGNKQNVRKSNRSKAVNTNKNLRGPATKGSSLNEGPKAEKSQSVKGQKLAATKSNFTVKKTKSNKVPLSSTD